MIDVYGLLLLSVSCSGDGNIQTVYHLSEYGILPVQPWSTSNGGIEFFLFFRIRAIAVFFILFQRVHRNSTAGYNIELAAVCIRSAAVGVCNCSSDMNQGIIYAAIKLAAPDAFSTRSIAFRVAALNQDNLI